MNQSLSSSTEKMPGHWVLAKLGKRVLRPGGLELTESMLDALRIQQMDRVVEFAPGLGITARKTVAKKPHSYIAVERDEQAAQTVRSILKATRYECRIASAEHTGLDDQCADVVYGEAMLTMQTALNKIAIVAEASRILKPGGRYGIHEICFKPNADKSLQKQITKDFSAVIHHGVYPYTTEEWVDLLQAHDLTMNLTNTAPLHLLEPGRIISDEGLFRTLFIAWNAILNPQARKRMLDMRALFKAYEPYLEAFTMIATKNNDQNA